jgi:hypothetical protein
MEKNKLLPVIAAIMIASMAVSMLSFSTTTVSAVTGASISPSTVGKGKWVVLTISITNDTGSSISRILIRDQDNKWDDPIGGHWSTRSIKENWDNMAENLGAAATRLSQVSENLREALTALQNAGKELGYAAENLKLAGDDLSISGRENADKAGLALWTAAQHLAEAATLLQQEPENLLLIGAWIDNFAGVGSLGDNLARAAENLAGDTNVYLKGAGENLRKLAGTDSYFDNVSKGIKGGVFWIAYDNLRLAADNLYNAGTNLQAYNGSGATRIQEAGTKLINAATKLSSTATYFKQMAENLSEAGTALATIRDTYFENAENLAMDNNLTTMSYLGWNFNENIGKAAIDLSTENQENILAAGENLRKAGLDLSAVQDATMVEFGSSYLGTRSDSVDNLLVKAGDNLRSRELLNITTAASAIDNAASQLNNAKSVLKATAARLAPNNWALTEPVNGDVQFQAENSQYQFASGTSKDFVFLWKAPTAGGSYTFKMWLYDNTGALRGTTSASITVDITSPRVVTFKVTQTGVAVDNVVGQVRDGGNATITLVASEAVSELGTAYIENTDGDNKLPPISMSDWTTADSITFTYQFPVGAWDDNSMRVRIAGPWASDAYANENSDDAIVNFIVDTRKPVFVDNGLAALEALPFKVQPGTGYSYRVDNKAEQIVNGIVQDNAGTRFGYDNQNTTVIQSITITWGTSSAAADFLPDENFYKALTLSEGLNSVVRITATDWAGNSENVYIENIFIDTQAPTIEFNTITRKTGAVTFSSGVRINDNTPEIKLTVLDPGYPTTGLGVAYDNLIVKISDNALAALNPDNFFAHTATYLVTLDNKSPWDPSTGVFENVIDNAGNGLVDGTYYIHVWASDNLFHGIENGKVSSRSFIIDTTKPATGDIQLTVTSYQTTTPVAPQVMRTTTLTITGTISASEVGGTINVYIDGVLAASVKTTTTAWSLSVTLTPGGVNGLGQKVEVSLTDEAGNESDKVLYGYFMADGSAPTVTISSPATGTATDKTSIQITGSVSKDDWEDYTELTVKIQVGGAAPGDVTLGADGSFTTSATLGEGTNVITITAKDAAGNVGSASITVERTVTPLTTYAIILVVVALILAAIAIFRREMK